MSTAPVRQAARSFSMIAQIPLMCPIMTPLQVCLRLIANFSTSPLTSDREIVDLSAGQRSTGVVEGRRETSFDEGNKEKLWQNCQQY